MIETIIDVIVWLGELLGVKRIRRWLRLEEKEPYFVDGTQDDALLSDPIVGPAVQKARESGLQLAWFPIAQVPAKLNRGYQHVRTADRRQIRHNRGSETPDTTVLLAIGVTDSRPE